MATSLPLRNIANLLQPPEPPLVGPGQMRLYSYYKPGLEAGNYAIEAEQLITATSDKWGQETLRVYNRVKTDPESLKNDPQVFEVMAPQFNLDPKMVNSYYPPDGHQDEGRILPHIVLNDPHFPWERYAGKTVAGLTDPDKDQNGAIILDNTHKIKSFRSMVPWIALVVFDPDELKVPNGTDTAGLSIPGTFTDSSSPGFGKQRANGTFPMLVSQYLNENFKKHRVDFESGMSNDPDGLTELRGSSEQMQAIFPTKRLFSQLFADVESFKYMAHVRNVHTEGFPDAGVEMNGLYSIVISRRTGAFNITQPTTQICHLVSIEHFDSTIAAASASSNPNGERIGLVSLYSWIYTALPPDPFDFVETIKNVTGGMQMLRPPGLTLKSASNTIAGLPVRLQSAATALARRLQNGYTMARWRAETGEESAAFNRGPLVPQKVPWPPTKDWPASSNYSKDYQIIDTATGMVDLSYSSAWQLGKILAIADTSFNSALMRFRSLVYSQAVSDTNNQINQVPPAQSLIAGLAPTISHTNTFSSQDVGDPRRIRAPLTTFARTLGTDSTVKDRFNSNLAKAVLDQASTFDPATKSRELYNQFNTGKPNNTDWTAIHTWISEKLSLSDIPAHFLIPDPSFLPEESLRFFYIDDSWLDCLIDGALSVANHLDRNDDRIRLEIKRTYNNYLSQKIGTTDVVPQIPCYGFILRTQIVKVMPDLKIEVHWNSTPTSRAPICRYTRLDDHTILCLLDRFPEELSVGADDKGGITLSQPPHQQRFSLGHRLDSQHLIVQLRHLYTKNSPTGEWKSIPAEVTQSATDPPTAAGPWFDWNSRVINASKMAAGINKMVRDNSRGDYQDYVPTSSELALELNDPSYYFKIVPEVPTSTATPRNRRLWTAEVTSSDANPLGNASTSDQDDDPSDVLGDVAKPPQKHNSTRPIVINHPTDGSPSRPSKTKFIDQPVAPVNPAMRGGSTIPQSCFSLQVYVDYKGPPTLHKDGFDAQNYVPCQNDYFFDLIFAVRKTISDATFSLREILINIPHSGNPDSKIEPLIYQDYDGGGPRMLSNQRFTPFVNITKEMYQIRLVPRSAQEHPSMIINDVKSQDLSFRLSDVNVMQEIKNPIGVQISGTPKPVPGLGPVRIDMYQRYDVPPNAVYSVYTKAFVIKKMVQDKDPFGNLL